MVLMEVLPPPMLWMCSGCRCYPASGIKTINSINSVNRFSGIENRLLDLVDAFNANGAHTKAASSPFFVLWKHVFGPQ